MPTATSVAGRPLAKPYKFSFTTPTVRLTSARWTRQGSRFDTPVQLALRFNQRVRAADVLAHVAARFEPHPVELPAFAPAERALLASSDPEGLKRFDAKIALARQTAARRDPVTLRLATDVGPQAISAQRRDGRARDASRRRRPARSCI